MKVKWYWIIIIVIVLGVVVDKYFQNKQEDKFKEKIETLEKERDSIKKQRLLYHLEIDSINNIIKSKNKKIESLTIKVDSLSKKRHEALNNVYNYDDAKLDSILTNYRHPKRN